MGFLNKIPEWLKLIIKIILTIAALGLVFYKIDFEKFYKIILESRWYYLIPALVIFVLSKIISSIRLNYFFRNITIQITTIKNLKLYWLGMFYNLFLPGGIGGDGYKIVLLNKKFKVSVKKIFQAVLLDRISGLSALLTLAGILSFFLPIKTWIIVLIWISIPILYFFYYKVVLKYFNQFAPSFQRTSILSFIVQIFQLLAVFFIIKALHINEYSGLYLIVFLFSSIIATIPFTIGGVGARELTFLYSATWLNLDSEQAISISFIFFTITAFVSLYGVIYNIDRDFENQFTEKVS